jgi:hypothetical protein
VRRIDAELSEVVRRRREEEVVVEVGRLHLHGWRSRPAGSWVLGVGVASRAGVVG